jgi:LacI family transcriptional regulator
VGAREKSLELLREARRPTAIFAGHDELALGVLQAIAELGLSAADVSVIGYDDTDIAAHPLVSMSSINQSGTRMGEIVVRLLLERIAGRTEPVHEVIAPKLMARNTTAPVTGSTSEPRVARP